MGARLILGCLVNVHAYMSGGPQNPMKMGTQVSLKYYGNRDLGPHFPMKWESGVPSFI